MSQQVHEFSKNRKIIAAFKIEISEFASKLKINNKKKKNKSQSHTNHENHLILKQYHDLIFE